MDILDQIFVAHFGRYRRRSGLQSEAAWNAALFQVLLFLGLGLFYVFLLSYILIWHVGAPQLKQQKLVIVASFYMIFYFLLRRRFQHYLTAPPTLVYPEPPGEGRLIVVFRAVCIALVVVVSAAIYAIGRLRAH